jgi:hypothetical protein
MRYCMHVTINRRDGSESEVVTNPRHLEDLKKIIGDMIADARDSASSFMFVISAQPRGQADE